MKSGSEDAPAAASYVLGHSDRELERLDKQAQLINPITRRFLASAGIVSGMRVLDVGSGSGDTAMLAAELVGAEGEVVGTDRSASALARAKQRVKARSLRNVDFREGNPAEMTFDRPFDAVIGRYVLMFQRDAAAMLRSLARHARRGGVIFFHEVDLDGARSSPPAPTYDRCCQWIAETLRLSGAEIRMGTRLFSTFVEAGLPPPSLQLETLISSVANNSGPLELIGGLVVTLADEMERLGVATAAEVGLDTLTDRMTSEAAASGSVVVGRFEIGAWSHV